MAATPTKSPTTATAKALDFSAGSFTDFSTDIATDLSSFRADKFTYSSSEASRRVFWGAALRAAARARVLACAPVSLSCVRRLAFAVARALARALVPPLALARARSRAGSCLR